MAGQQCIIQCNFCLNTFTKKSSLSNHLKRCKEKQNLIDNHQKQIQILTDNYEKKIKTLTDNSEKQIKEFKDEINNYKSKIELLETKLDCFNKLLNKDEVFIDNLKDTNKQYKSIVDNAGKIVDKSMSAFNMIVTKFNQAPAIKEFDDFDSIKKCIKDNEKYDLADLIIYHYTKKELGDFLGDFIITEYKKENPSEQSFWVTDVTRLSCVVRKAIDENKAIWDRDKNAEYAKKYLIEPIVNFVQEIMIEKDKKSATIIQKSVPGILGTANCNSATEKKYLGKTWEEAYFDQMKTREILQPVAKKKLEEDILNKIITVFTVNKEHLLIE